MVHVGVSSRGQEAQKPRLGPGQVSGKVDPGVEVHNLPTSRLRRVLRVVLYIINLSSDIRMHGKWQDMHEDGKYSMN